MTFSVVFARVSNFIARLFTFSERRRARTAAFVALGAATALVSAACDTTSAHRVAHRSAHRRATAASTRPKLQILPPEVRSASASPAMTPSASATHEAERPTDSPASRSLVSHRAVPPASQPVVPQQQPSPSQSSGGSAAAAKTAADYKLFTNSDGTIVRWNPCAPIHYAVDLSQAPDPAVDLRDVQTAVADVASASGLSFVYDGPTSVVPTKAWLDSGSGSSSSALVIAWARPGTASGTSDLYGGDADGEGGWWESGTSTDGVHWVWQIKRGFVVIDPTTTESLATGFGAGETLGVLLMHELGHAVGLGHTDNQRDVMFPVITQSSRAQWGPGDLAGLARIGSAAGCIA